MGVERSVTIGMGSAHLAGDLRVPPDARGVVLFAHGSDSSRLSPRNRQIAEGLNAAGLATLLVDLLTAHEEAVDARTGHLRFNIGFLADRLLAATAWLAEEPATASLPRGYVGPSTGAAAALVAAAARPEDVDAVVSRGGRPDLAGAALARVRAATLLIVGGDDPAVLELNRGALERLRVDKRLEVVPGAGHLFEEPGALAEVTRLAREWFLQHLGRRPAGVVPEGREARWPR